MVTNIKLKRISIFIFTLLLILSFSTIIFGQNKKLDSEILVYFLPDSLELPNGIIQIKDLSQLNIKSKSLGNTIRKLELKSIKKAFPNFDESDTVKILKDGRIIKLPNMSRIFILELKSKNYILPSIKELRKEKSVLFAERNMDAKTFSDPTYTNQWYLNNTGQSGGTNDADIDAPEAWSIFTGSSSVKIAIIDRGVQINHDDLSGKVSGDSYDPQDPEGYHGTHVAGIAAAKANNSYGGRGVDWNAQILSRQIFNKDGYMGDVNTYNKICDAVNSGANIINNSWGGTFYSTTVRMAFAYAYKMNRVSTAAMGNDYQYGNQTKYPAAFGQGIIAVGATTDDDTRSPFSQTGNHIDVTAPGGINPYPYNNKHDIWSTWTGNSYGYLAGTSMATPVVTGIASLLKGYNSSLSNDDIENIIKISADDKGTTGWDQYYGTGRVNARKALELLRSPYVLNHKSANGGSVNSATDTYGTTFYGVSGLADGYYIVKRYDVRKYVNFGQTYNDLHVWGRGVGTNGFSLESPNYGMGYCDVVSYNSSSATLRTYVYQVWDVAGQYLGYYPTTPSNVHFEYTVLGKIPPLSVYISGPHFLNVHEEGTWTANASGGTPPYHYQWWYRYPSDIVNATKNEVQPLKPPHGYWFKVGTDSPTLTRSDDEDFELKCDVTDAANSTVTSSIFYVTVGGNSSPSVQQNSDKNVINILPKETKLLSNYPNPFNPTTAIKFGLPEDVYVRLTIYSINGRKIRTLINGQVSKGYHQVVWDGTNESGQPVSGGLYIYELKTENKRILKKMLLVK